MLVKIFPVCRFPPAALGTLPFKDPVIGPQVGTGWDTVYFVLYKPGISDIPALKAVFLPTINAVY